MLAGANSMPFMGSFSVYVFRQSIFTRAGLPPPHHPVVSGNFGHCQSTFYQQNVEEESKVEQSQATPLMIASFEVLERERRILQ
jgi:hypothetical protein